MCAILLIFRHWTPTAVPPTMSDVTPAARGDNVTP
jgi:hypothetical protein